MSATADLLKAWELYRDANFRLQVGQYPDPQPLLAEIILVIRAQSARISLLEARLVGVKAMVDAAAPHEELEGRR